MPFLPSFASLSRLIPSSWTHGRRARSSRRAEDASDKGLEFSLVVYLAWREHDDDLIELAVRHYPHGQIGGGKLKGGNADRRLDKLIEEAEKIRAKGSALEGAQAWFRDLQTSEEGIPRDCLANGSTILNKDPAFAGKIRFDEHRGAPLCHDMPWRAARLARVEQHRRYPARRVVPDARGAAAPYHLCRCCYGGRGR